MSEEQTDADRIPPPSAKGVGAILTTIVVLAFLMATGNVLLILLGGPQVGMYVVGLNGALVPIIMALLAFLSRQTHDTVNSRMDKYEQKVEALARAQGNREGRAEQAAEGRGDIEGA